MKGKTENRSNQRFTYQSTIKHANYDTGFLFPAKMKDHCRDGMNFESEQKLAPGSEIFIRTDNTLPAPTEFEPNIAYRAKVVWCRQLTSDAPRRYSVGVQYLKE